MTKDNTEKGQASGAKDPDEIIAESIGTGEVQSIMGRRAGQLGQEVTPGLRRFRLVENDDSLSGSGPRGGDELVVLQCSACAEGACVVLARGDERHAGYFYRRAAGRVALEPDSPDYETREFDASEVSVVGWVLGFLKPSEVGGMIHPLRRGGH